jgi:hypothetical protein
METTFKWMETGDCLLQRQCFVSSHWSLEIAEWRLHSNGWKLEIVYISNIMFNALNKKTEALTEILSCLGSYAALIRS